MQRTVLTTLAVTLALLGGMAVAGPAEPPLPESTPQVTEDPAVADSETLDPAHQAPAESSTCLQGEDLELSSPETDARQEASCIYTCRPPLGICPSIGGLPDPQCINGCCVYY